MSLPSAGTNGRRLSVDHKGLCQYEFQIHSAQFLTYVVMIIFDTGLGESE